MDNFEPGEYTESSMQAVYAFRDNIMPHFSKTVEAAISTMSNNGSGPVKEDEFVDACRWVYDGVSLQFESNWRRNCKTVNKLLLPCKPKVCLIFTLGNCSNFTAVYSCISLWSVYIKPLCIFYEKIIGQQSTCQWYKYNTLMKKWTISLRLWKNGTAEYLKTSQLTRNFQELKFLSFYVDYNGFC